ncbi:MAG: fused MFS/spermidine synthase, partial [Myxococcales bacterium]|nr:fused MFS/spermidine synthase [Myxococcales bacterium]
SGAAALVYEAAWARMLHRVFGVSDHAIATVLAAYFLGMGLGASLGGRLGIRLRRPSRGYALLEIAIGIWALASPWMIPSLHGVYASLGAGLSFGALTALRLALALLVLLPPTILMGATLPVLIGAVCARGPHWTSTATHLYAANTVGATIGAAATGLFLVPTLGARLTVWIAALGSFGAAALVALTWRDRAGPAAAGAPGAAARAPWTARAITATSLAALAGAAALAGEVLWTRVLRTFVQGTTQAFAAMLANYLLGIALGSLLAGWLLRRGTDASRAFGGAQLALVVLTSGAAWMAGQLPRMVAMLHGSTLMVPHEPWVLLLSSAALLLPLAIALGTAIPLAWRVAGDRADHAPKHAGRVLAANTVGGLFGALAGGFLLVPALGISASLRILLLVHGVAALLALLLGAPNRRRRLGSALLAITVIAASWLAFPGIPLPYLLDAWYEPERAVLEGPGEGWDEPLLLLREGRNTTVTVLRRDSALRLFNDGRPESGLSGETPGYGPELGVLGGLPSIFAETRERALVVGLGGGHSTSVLLAGPWREVVVVELEEAVVEAARFMHDEYDKPFPLDDPRARLIVDDARAQLALQPPGSFDAVVSQPSHPWLAGSSALYTREFFEEVRRALRPGGVFSLWVNLFRIDVTQIRAVVATLLEIFPHALAFIPEQTSFVILASEAALPLDARAAARIRTDSGLGPILDPYALGDLIDLVSVLELDTAGARAFARGGAILRDDRPDLEFALARIPHDLDLHPAELDRAFGGIPWLAAETVAAMDPEDREDILLTRIETREQRPDAIPRVLQTLEAASLEPSLLEVLRGVAAETRGDVNQALARYDAAGSRLGATRADRLRHVERAHWELVRSLERRSVLPTSARWLLLSALATDSRAALERALEVAHRIEDPSSRVMAEIAQVYLEQGCEAALAHPRMRESRQEELHFLAERCSFERGDLRGARYHAERRAELRLSLSANETVSARETEATNPWLAIRFYRRALEANPAHGHAAAGLARLLVAEGREEAAGELLRRSNARASGLPGSRQAIRDAAAELGVDLSL